MPERRLAVIDVKPGEAMESQSGLQMKAPQIYGAYEEPADRKRWAATIMHPTSNFMGHYLISPLARRGLCCLGVNSRYAGNNVVLLMERVIQDLGAAVTFLKGLGYERVALIGNSGGGSLAAFYQAQAEKLTVTRTPAGDPHRSVAGRSSARRRNHPDGGARRPLPPVRRVDRSGTDGRARHPVARSIARCLRPEQWSAILARISPPVPLRAARAPRSHRGLGDAAPRAAPRKSGWPARRSFRHSSHASRPSPGRPHDRRK